jgi:hypothetical protein
LRGIIALLPVIIFIAALHLASKLIPGYEFLRSNSPGNYLLYRYGGIAFDFLLVVLIASSLLPTLVVVGRLFSKKPLDEWDYAIAIIDIVAGLVIFIPLLMPTFIGSIWGDQHIDTIEAEKNVYHLYHLWDLQMNTGDCFADTPECKAYYSQRNCAHNFVVVKCNLQQTNCRNVFSSSRIIINTPDYTFDIHFEYDETIGQVTVVDSDGGLVATIP